MVRWSEVALTVLLAVALADLAWDLAPGPQPGVSAPSGPVAGADGQAAPTPSSGGPLTRPVKTLFGAAPGRGASAASPEPVRETGLDLTLTGVLAREGHRDQRLAVIAGGDGEETVYRVGDRVQGARIVRIEPRRVILVRNGVTEALNLKAERVETGTGSPSGGPARGGIRRTGTNQRVVSRDTLKRKLDNLPRLLRQAKAVPHKRDGQQVGFKVINIQQGSVFEDLGIQQGDVIQSVNGRSIRNPKQALTAYRELRSAKKFRVDVLRDGQPTTLQYAVK
jgi:general secretion pathway protein C